MVDAVLIAQLVEFLLVDEGIQQAAVDVGGNYIFRQGVLAVGGQLDIAVPAAQEDHLFAGKLLRRGLDVTPEGGLVLVVRAHPIVNDGAAVAGEGWVLAKGHRAHPVGLVEGPGHAVYVDIAAKEQRLEFQVRHDKTSLNVL